MQKIHSETIYNLACCVGLDNIDIDKLNQFAIEIQAHTLMNFADWVRTEGDKNETVNWNSVAINAEFEALTLDSWTI